MVKSSSAYNSVGRHLTPLSYTINIYTETGRPSTLLSTHSLHLLLFSPPASPSSSASKGIEMESPEEAFASNSSDSISNAEFVHAVVKGKRTKRQRTQPPPPPPPPQYSPEPAALSVAVADSSSVSSAEAFSGTITEEDEDMANCLILLAQGRALGAGHKAEEHRDDKFTSRRLVEAATTGKAGVYVYECKTCNKCFPSFQALGGHRTSHKKPKLDPTPAADEKKSTAGEEDPLQISTNSFARSAATNASKPKVHECSICGSEFSSGQALGGHMRRHRPVVAAESQEAASNPKEKSFLALDLNLPAPTDDDHQRPPSPAQFSLVGKRPFIFPPSASALAVDCHY